MRVLVLVTDAFGGFGGISQYNKDLLTGLCLWPKLSEVVAIPRLMPNPPEPLPAKLTWRVEGISGKISYIREVWRAFREKSPFDLILCAHLHLMPIAWILKKLSNAPLVLTVFGIEAWQPSRVSMANRSVASADFFLSISRYTNQRFVDWSGVPIERTRILPNAIHLEQYGQGSKSDSLLKRYHLHGKRVLMTFGRMVEKDRHKGFDEVIAIMPELVKRYPDLIYMACGDGADKPRLEGVAKTLGVSEHVLFAGKIPEEEKAEHYRLADVYVMPSRGEGFGFVFLEAMACGIPVIASKVDGSRDAVMDGKLGLLVDPSSPGELISAIEQAMATPKGVPENLAYFSYPNFISRLHKLLEELLLEKKDVRW